jgi:hypothetical protein
MRQETFAASLRSFCNRQPFRPFFVQLVTGERLFVPHPETISLRENVAIYYTPLRQYHLFDASSVCRVLDPGRD